MCINVYRAGGVVDIASAYIYSVGSLLLAVHSDATNVIMSLAEGLLL